MRRQPLTAPGVSGSDTFRRRAALEIGALVSGATAFLALVPARPVAVDMALAAFALVLVALGRKTTRQSVWGPRPPALAATRATWILAAATLAAGAIVAVAGSVRDGAAAAMFPRSLGTLVVFVPWAWLQHVMFQFYLLGRLRILFSRLGTVALAAVNASAFAASHAPEWDVVLVTWPVGWLWSVYYLSARRLLPIAVSHAVLATAYFYWVRDEDVLGSWLSMAR